MKKIIIFTLVLFGFNACTPSIPIKKNLHIGQKHIIIDLDEEFLILKSMGKLRNKNNIILDNPIYIGDNDEVSFKGDTLNENAPISITIGKNKPIIIRGTSYSIKTMEINNGEIIQMKDKNGNIFLEMEVLKD